jgi:hypothetical protein
LVKTTERGYGNRHQLERKRWAAKVRAGVVDCTECGRPINPDEAWHLCHDHDGDEPSRPGHVRCNLRERNRRHAIRRRLRRASRQWW